jgi:hypothetical protein
MPAQVKSDHSLGMQTPMSFEQAIMRNVFNKTVPVTNVLMGMPGPGRMIDKVKHNRTDEHMPLHMERLEYAKRLKMLSLNPSIYGNIYGVLANS